MCDKQYVTYEINNVQLELFNLYIKFCDQKQRDRIIVCVYKHFMDAQLFSGCYGDMTDLYTVQSVTCLCDVLANP